VSFSPVAGTLVAAAFLGGFVGLGLAYATWRRRETRGATRFVPYVLSYSGWMLAAGLLWTSSTQPSTLFFQSLIYVFAVLTLVFWTLFVVSYTGEQDRFAGWRRTALLGWAGIVIGRTALTPVVGFPETEARVVEYQGLTLIATRPSVHNLVNLAILVAILVWTFVLLGRFYRSEIAGQRRQTGMIFVAAIAPAIATIGYNVGNISLYEHLDPTPLFFTVTVVGTWIALFAYDFLDVEPIAAKTLFETMTDPVVILDDDETILSVNEAATTLRLSADEGRCRSLVAAIEADETELRLETIDGDERIFDLSVSPLTDSQDRQRGRLVVLRDVTLRIQRKRRLERQNERLDEFASVVSHDLRNPLNVAEGNLTLAEETGDLTRLEPAHQSLDRMGKIIDDLLTMARVGSRIESTEPVSISAVAQAAWQQTESEGSKLQIRTEATVDADRSRLQNVFENCFRNATEHNEAPVTIRVDAITAADDDSVVGFAITDDGVGIPPEDRKRIFDHGYTTNIDGTGFGLPIVHNIVTAHGWECTVTESETGGARFEITWCEAPTEDRTPTR